MRHFHITRPRYPNEIGLRIDGKTKGRVVELHRTEEMARSRMASIPKEWATRNAGAGAAGLSLKQPNRVLFDHMTDGQPHTVQVDGFLVRMTVCDKDCIREEF